MTHTRTHIYIYPGVDCSRLWMRIACADLCYPTHVCSIRAREPQVTPQGGICNRARVVQVDPLNTPHPMDEMFSLTNLNYELAREPGI